MGLRHFPGVRVPIPLVLLLSLAVVGGVWWYGSRNSDFLAPPPAAELAGIRAKVAASLPPADHPNDVATPPPEVSQPPPQTPPETPKPTIDLGNLDQTPTLVEYSNIAPIGVTHLMDLAVLLETEREFQRALLAWERVLDTGNPDGPQTQSALSAIKRLRPSLPPWNTDPTKALAITLHAGTGKKSAKILKPVLEEVAHELELSSSGILKVTVSITAGRDNRTPSGPAPVALWLAGPTKDTPSTEVLAFTAESPENLHEEVRKTVFRIIRSYLPRSAYTTPAPALPDGTPALDALNFHLTRLNWHNLGTILNRSTKPSGSSKKP